MKTAISILKGTDGEITSCKMSIGDIGNDFLS